MSRPSEKIHIWILRCLFLIAGLGAVFYGVWVLGMYSLNLNHLVPVRISRTGDEAYLPLWVVSTTSLVVGVLMVALFVASLFLVDNKSSKK